MGDYPDNSYRCPVHKRGRRTVSDERLQFLRLSYCPGCALRFKPAMKGGKP